MGFSEVRMSQVVNTFSPKQTCPACQSTEVRSTLVTAQLVHLCCSACGHLWTMPERRAARFPKRDDDSAQS